MNPIQTYFAVSAAAQFLGNFADDFGTSHYPIELVSFQRREYFFFEKMEVKGLIKNPAQD